MAIPEAHHTPDWLWAAGSRGASPYASAPRGHTRIFYPKHEGLSPACVQEGQRTNEQVDGYDNPGPGRWCEGSWRQRSNRCLSLD